MSEWVLLGAFILLFALAMVVLLSPFREHRKNVLLLALLFGCVVAAAYWRFGSWLDWEHYLQQSTQQQQVDVMLKSVNGIDGLVRKLRAKLDSDPNSTRGWYLLGRLYASQNQWVNARDSFETAHRLKPNSEKIAINYAQSLWQLNHQQFNDNIRALFHAVLQKNQHQPDALAMLAMDAFINHSYQQAIEYWQRLLALTPSQSEEAKAIRKAIAKAQQLRNSPATSS